MCTLVILFQPEQRWPLILAGNRDEMRDRPSAPPSHHWPAQPDVIAGLDHLGGGTWMGMNRAGVVATVMNREGTLGPATGKRSRGDLVLEALKASSAKAAVETVKSIPAHHYRAFNLFIGDRQNCFWLRNRDEGEMPELEAFRIEPGLHMLTSRELDDRSHPRIDFWLPLFQNARPPVPEQQMWEEWIQLLAGRMNASLANPHAAMNMDFPMGFATVSCSLIALAQSPDQDRPIWMYADGAPDRVEFTPVEMEA
ncbi:NRDE family protein [Sedimenticola sp.]|uniref:NRDE family protein n=1 Tax=Sedimenticola sp. TaxID=1940285 RepID=UPI003D130FB5